MRGKRVGMVRARATVNPIDFGLAVCAAHRGIAGERMEQRVAAGGRQLRVEEAGCGSSSMPTELGDASRQPSSSMTLLSDSLDRLSTLR
jgi:hypothetical protein